MYSRKGWTKTLKRVIRWHLGVIAVLLFVFTISAILVQFKVSDSFSISLSLVYLGEMVTHRHVALGLSLFLLLVSIGCWNVCYTEYRDPCGEGYPEDNLHLSISHSVMAAFWFAFLLGVLIGNNWMKW